jgi:hypothetical protein
MAVEIKTHPDHPASMAERVNKRLRNSGAGAFPDTTVQNGSSAQRVFHNIHLAGHRPNPGTAARESAPIEQHRHGPATTQGVGYRLKGGGGDGR